VDEIYPVLTYPVVNLKLNKRNVDIKKTLANVLKSIYKLERKFSMALHLCIERETEKFVLRSE
jgi:hypothetical protein